MKKLLLSLLFLGMFVSQALAYDVEYKNNVVTIKKSALTQVVTAYGIQYDSYCSCRREYGKISFSFKPGSYDPYAKNAFVASRGGVYAKPTGAANMVDNGDSLSIPYSLFISSNAIQIEPEFYDQIEDMVDDILPFYSSTNVVRFPINYLQLVYK